MIDLTPLDVRKKRDDFKRTMRGYEPGQVDGFLEMCAERMEQLIQRDSRQQGELAALRERVGAFEERERALNEALVTAQELREEARAQAERTAELKLREAGQEADAILLRAESATDSSRRALADLQIRRAGFLRSLRSSFERFLGEIEAEERRLAAEEESAVAVGGDAPSEGRESPATGETGGANAGGVSGFDAGDTNAADAESARDVTQQSGAGT